MNTIRNRRGYTLNEMLAVLAVLTSVGTLCTRALLSGWQETRGLSEHVYAAQLAEPIRGSWRRLVGKTSSSNWDLGSKSFRAGDQRAWIDGNALKMTSGDGISTFFLPGGVECEFRLEHETDWRPCAILTLRWVQSSFGHDRKHSIPIVACAAGGEGE